MPHDRDTAYRLYSDDGDSVPTLVGRIGQTVPDDPFKKFLNSLTPEAEKWRSRQISLRPEAEKQQFRQDWLGTVQSVCISSGTPPIYHVLEKCSATFSSYLSLTCNPVFEASTQKISRPLYTAVVALTATCELQ